MKDVDPAEWVNPCSQCLSALNLMVIFRWCAFETKQISKPNLLNEEPLTLTQGGNILLLTIGLTMLTEWLTHTWLR